ncbi:DUF6233 domain-containing protein [Streptomyces bauhiniae]|uniref:DUF6233 domain-containing protein n=1 Tax=Streptomyces bauhiniae TaxID=2340725 RepID=UPI0037D4FE56
MGTFTLEDGTPLLPPDGPRLRAILAHLERQAAETEIIAQYLRFQAQAVREALARTERRPTRQHGRLAKGAKAVLGFSPTPRKTGFVMERKQTATSHEPVLIHLTDCEKADAESATAIRPDEARSALVDPSFAACTRCRPENELGIDVA